MLLIAIIPIFVAVLSRYVLSGRKQNIVVDSILFGGFFVNLLLGFILAYHLCKLLVITTLMGLCIKWIVKFEHILIAMLCVVTIGMLWVGL